MIHIHVDWTCPLPLEKCEKYTWFPATLVEYVLQIYNLASLQAFLRKGHTATTTIACNSSLYYSTVTVYGYIYL